MPNNMQLRGGTIEAGAQFTPQLPTVSDADACKVYYDGAQQALLLSSNGSPYAPLSVAGQGALAQAAWFVDPLTGNDRNSGATALTALATLGEYLRRIGDGEATVSQVVTIIGTINEGTYRFQGSWPLGLTIQGQRTVLHSGVVSVVVAWNTGVTPIVDQRITDNSLATTWSAGGPAGTTLIGRMIVMTSGAQLGRVAFPIEDLQATTAKTARVSQFVDPFTFATGTPALNDTFDVVSLSVLQGVVIFESRDVAGFGFVDFEDIEIVSPGGPPLVGRAGSVGAGASIFRQTVGGGNDMQGVQSTWVGCLFGGVASGCHVGIANTNNCLFASCGLRDARVQVNGARCAWSSINAAQRASAGGIFPNDNQITAFMGANVTIAGAFIAFDLNNAAQACLRINAGGLVDVAGVAATFATIAGFGAFVDAVATALWTAGGNATTFYRFSGGTEWRIGGANTTSAALAAVGAITAANHAAAVPHPT